MAYQSNLKFGPEFVKRSGQLLIVAANEIESELTKKLSRSYPPASKPGEYPARRTGNLMNSPMHLPVKALEVGAAGKLRLGWAARADYGGRLEVLMRRLGLLETTKRLKSHLKQLLSKIGGNWSERP